MFVRFVLLRHNDASGVKDGFFSAAYSLKGDPRLSKTERDSLTTFLDWFEQNLLQPERLNRSNSKGYYRRQSKGVSWFKPHAVEHIGMARNLMGILQDHGFHTEMLKTERPGYLVYEDEYQIVAEPFRDTPG